MIQLLSIGLAVQGAASPHFGLMAHVSSWVQLGTRPRVGAQPQHLFGHQSIYLYPSRVAMVVGFCLDQV